MQVQQEEEVKGLPTISHIKKHLQKDMQDIKQVIKNYQNMSKTTLRERLLVKLVTKKEKTLMETNIRYLG